MNAFQAWQLLLAALAVWINQHQQNLIDYIHEEIRILKHRNSQGHSGLSCTRKT